MQLQEFYLIENALDDKTIDKIIALGNEYQDGTVGTDDGQQPDHDIRRTDVCWLREDWLFDICFNYMSEANAKTGWNIDVDCCEDLQLGKYEKSHFYDWHIDSNGFNLHDPKGGLLDFKTRKISMVAWLNDDFKGGEFEFHKSVSNFGCRKMPKGAIMFFPSWLVHRVRPVKEGTRYSLVTWFNGNKVK